MHWKNLLLLRWSQSHVVSFSTNATGMRPGGCPTTERILPSIVVMLHHTAIARWPTRYPLLMAVVAPRGSYSLSGPVELPPGAFSLDTGD